MIDEMIGMQFGRLTVIEKAADYVSPTGGIHKRYLCECTCGNTTIALKEWLTSGSKKSCGCLRHESRGKTHGEIHTRLYKIWGNMCNRCSNPNNPAWERYGGVEIYVCEEWKHYENFREWAYKSGYSDDLTIDRIDNSKGYNPDNCRWADRIQQANNKTCNLFVEYNGETKTLSEWARVLEIPYKTLHRRVVSLGWKLEQAFTQPLRKRHCEVPNIQDGQKPNMR